MISQQTCEAAPDEQGLSRDPAAWFSSHRADIEAPALNPFAQAAALTFLAEYERVPECIEAIAALNRWPGRTGVSIEEYLRFWEANRQLRTGYPQLACGLPAL